MAKKKTDDEIWEWFYEHDNEWQNDLWSESNAGDYDELLQYIKENYNVK